MDELMMFSNNDELYIDMIKSNLEKRILIFNQSIDDSLLESYIMNIIKWNEEDRDIPVDKRKAIWIILNSGGGETLSGIMFLDVIQQSITPIKCLVIGIAASMASYIPMITESYGFKNSIICLHDGQSGVYSSSRKANDIMEFYKSCDDVLEDIILNNTSMTEEFLEGIADREFYVFSKKAKELGIIDYIIGEDCTLDDVLI